MEERIIEVLKDFNEEITEDMERDLLSADILDSFDIIKLVMNLEDEFDIMIDVEDVEPTNFQTANAIVAMVKEKVENN